MPCTQQELETERTESSNNNSQVRKKDGRMVYIRAVIPHASACATKITTLRMKLMKYT